MSIRRTVTLDEDVFENIKLLAKKSGVSFQEALNLSARIGYVQQTTEQHPRPRFKIEAFHMGANLPGVNYHKISELLAADATPARNRLDL